MATNERSHMKADARKRPTEVRYEVIIGETGESVWRYRWEVYANTVFIGRGYTNTWRGARKQARKIILKDRRQRNVQRISGTFNEIEEELT